MSDELKRAVNKNKIHAMDCIEGMTHKMGRKSVDVVVTSPPYNIGKKYNKYSDSMPRGEYIRWLGGVAGMAKRVMKDEASFFLNIGGNPSDQWLPLDVAREFGRHFYLQNTIHWIKSIYIPKEDTRNYSHIRGDVAAGHYQPVNSDKYLNGCHEYIFHFTKTGDVNLDKLAIGVPYQDKSNINRWDKKGEKSDLRGRGNTWFIPYPTIKESRPHPTVFPVKLPEMCIKLHGISDDMLVMDPFMGIGSTAIACQNLGVDYIGFEIDSSYVVIAEELVEKRENLNKFVEG